MKKKMKKTFSILAFMLSVALLVGCSADTLTENNYPDYWKQRLHEETESTMIDLTNSNIRNIGDFEKQVKLVAYTIEKNKPFSIAFLYSGESGNVYTLPEIQDEYRLMNSHEYREELKNTITNEVLGRLEELQMESGDVVATILTWNPSNDYTNVSLCDLDGDGSWDYLVDSYAFFGSSSSGKYPSVTIGENEIMLIPDLPSRDIITLNNLSGDEKLSDFMKLR